MPHLADLSPETLQSITEQAWDLTLQYAPRVIGALLTLLIGWKIAKFVGKLIARALEAREVDETLRPFVSALVTRIIQVAVVLSAMSTLGIESTSFIAVLGAAGIAIGMALSGTLQNFAGGILILLQRPIEVGDFVEAGGLKGTVKEIRIFNTVLTTPDNKVVTIPNNDIATSSLTNYTTESTRRVELIIGISYDDSIDDARAIIKGLIDADVRILKDPEPAIVISSLGDNSVNFAVRVWCATEEFWPVHNELIENIKKSFDEKGITIPYPQMDVHVAKDGAAK